MSDLGRVCPGAFLTDLYRDRRGGVAIMFMFMAIGLFGFVALALDTSIWYSTKQKMQTAADAAARAGAHQLLRVTVKPEEVVASATADAAKHGFTAAKGAAVTVTSDSVLATVETNISMPASLNFARLFLSEPPTVSARAVASAPQTPPPCLTLLEPTSGPALRLGGGTRVSSPSCRLQVNSTGTNALDIRGGGSVNAAQICVGGTYTGSGTTVPVERCDPLPDPLTFWQPPAYGGCTQLLPILIKYQTLTINNTSGTEVYCNLAFTISASTVTFSPGLYVLVNTTLTINEDAIVTGDGVGFLLVGTSKLYVEDAKVSFKAPRDGQMAGMIVSHARDAAVGVMHIFKDADVSYEGAFYLPQQDVTYSGTTTSTNVPPFTTFIVRRLVLADQGNLKLDDEYAASDVPVVGKIGAGVVLTQ